MNLFRCDRRQFSKEGHAQSLPGCLLDRSNLGAARFTGSTSVRQDDERDASKENEKQSHIQGEKTRRQR